MSIEQLVSVWVVSGVGIVGWCYKSLKNKLDDIITLLATKLNRDEVRQIVADESRVNEAEHKAVINRVTTLEQNRKN